MTKIAVFVDVQNVFYTTREAFGRHFNYRKLMEQVSADGEIVSATAYAIENRDSDQRRFLDAIASAGFKVKTKPLIRRSDGSMKGDWDVGIAIDVIDAAQQVDTIVLVSGDGDFDVLLKKVRADHGVRAEVYGVRPLTALSLVNAANSFHRIDERMLL